MGSHYIELLEVLLNCRFENILVQKILLHAEKSRRKETILRGVQASANKALKEKRSLQSATWIHVYKSLFARESGVFVLL